LHITEKLYNKNCRKKVQICMYVCIGVSMKTCKEIIQQFTNTELIWEPFFILGPSITVVITNLAGLHIST
jgi:hypothetical protein